MAMTIVSARLRIIASDIFCTGILFIAAAIMSGRIARFPFDDEIYTLRVITSNWTIPEFLGFFLHGGDVHPPVSYLFFLGLHAIGAGETALRAVSCLLMAAALMLIHGWTLTLLERRHQGPVPPVVRLAAILLFGLNALAISQGDAIRWYPLFSLLTALFLVLYLTRRSPASAIPLGLAASTNFLALPLAACFCIWRYLLERRLELRFELTFWALFGFFALPGLITAASLALPGFHPPHGTQFDYGMVKAFLNNALGFFGGNSLGITQVWVTVPIMLISGAAIWTLADRATATNPLNLFLLLCVPALLMTLGGFSKPRSFLYLAPIFSSLITVFIADLVARAKLSQAIILTTLALCSLVGATTSLRSNDRPFKRNTVLPLADMLNVVRQKSESPVLALTNEVVSTWLLRQMLIGPGDCVIGAGLPNSCSPDLTRYRTVVNVYVPKAKERKPTWSPWSALQEYSPAFSIFLGQDLDADAKSRLTGYMIPEHLMELEIYTVGSRSEPRQ